MRSLSESHSTATAAGHVDTETASESGARAATGAKLKRLSKLAARGGVSASKGAEAKGKGKSAGGASASPGARRARQSHSSAAHADDAASGSGAAAASTDPTAARLPPAIAHLFPDGRMHLPEKVTLDDFAVFCEAKSQVLQVGLLVYIIYAVFSGFLIVFVVWRCLQTMNVTSPRMAAATGSQQLEPADGKEVKKKQRRKLKPLADGSGSQPSGGDEESTTQSSAVADSSSVRSSHSHSTGKLLEVSPGGGVSLRFPPAIVFGKWDIKTWYSAPYPQEYARCALRLCSYNMYLRSH